MSLERQRAGDHAIEEHAIVADQEHRSGKVRDELLEQLQRLDVEVVGRLVEDQHVGGPREQPREQQPVALAAGQRSHRRLRALARKQEVREVTHDVFRLAVDDDGAVPVVDRVGDRAIGIELFTLLIEVGDLETRAVADRAVIGLSSPTSSRSSVDLPDPFGPISPTRSPRRMRCE